MPDSLSLVTLAIVLLAAAYFGWRDYRLRHPADAPAPVDVPAGPAPCTPWGRVRQQLRRWNWFYLFAAGLLLYPVQISWQAHRAAANMAGPDRLDAMAAALGKVVDPDQVYSKMSLAVGVFCLINLLAWGALNLAFDVLTNWAKGAYSDAGQAAAVGRAEPVVGFKRTFLSLEPLPRLVVYFLFFALEIYASSSAVYYAFRIQ